MATEMMIQAEHAPGIANLAIGLDDNALCRPPAIYGTYAEAVKVMIDKYAKGGYELAGQYEYNDTAERMIYCKLCFKNSQGCPLESFVSQNSDGGWAEAMPEPDQRVLYNEHLLKVYHDEVVYYVADEETANYLTDHGKLATTSVEGMHTTLRTNIDCLRGRSNVVIVMGKGYADKHCNAEKIKRLLRNKAQIINLEGVDLGEGAVDWFEKGYDITHLDELTDDIKADQCEAEERIDVEISDAIPYAETADLIFKNIKDMYWYKGGVHVYENGRIKRVTACMLVSRIEDRFNLYTERLMGWSHPVRTPVKLSSRMARVLLQTKQAEQLPYVNEIADHPVLVEGHEGPVILRHGYNPEQKVFVLSKEQIRAVPLEEAKQKLGQLLYAYQSQVPEMAVRTPVLNLMDALQVDMNALPPHNPMETASDNIPLNPEYQGSPGYGNVQHELQAFLQGELMEYVKSNYAEYLGCIYAVAKAWYDKRQRAGIAGQVCRCGITALDMMTESVSDAILLPGHHKSHTESIQSPALKMFYDMAIMAQRYSKLNQGMTAVELVEFAIQHGIAIPGMTDADTRSAARALGWKRKQVFGDRGEVIVGGFVIRACQKPVYSDTWRSERLTWVYEVLQLAGDQNMLNSGQVKTEVLTPHPYAQEPSITYPGDTEATGEGNLQESGTNDFMF